jgi:cell division protein FtsQ
MKFFKANKILNYVLLISGTLIALVLVISATQKKSSKRCKGLVVIINNHADELLVTKTDVENWATNFGNNPFDGKIIENIELSEIEKKVQNAGYVKKCQAYTNLQSELVLEVQPYKPIARILGEGENSDKYLDEDGNTFPISKHFSPKITLLSGSFFNHKKNLKTDKDVFDLISTITSDKFWEAQITQIDINKNKEVVLLPLLGNNKIEFGKPEKIQSKLNRLMVFYNKILPQTEWSSFSGVSVKFDGQIVCN